MFWKNFFHFVMMKVLNPKQTKCLKKNNSGSTRNTKRQTAGVGREVNFVILVAVRHMSNIAKLEVILLSIVKFILLNCITVGIFNSE
jgi:hypothetical protein